VVHVIDGGVPDLGLGGLPLESGPESRSGPPPEMLA
jgi:hypothetical protein